MTLPTPSKTWQYDVNIAVGSSGVLETDIDDTLLEIVNALKSFALSAWTVWGSCDSAACGNGDTTDRWVDIGDIVHAAGAHSWIVLYNAGAGVYLCIDTNSATVYSGVWSFSQVGFGAANGGADGTTTAAPTALDQVTLVSGSCFATSAFAGKLHVMHSSDGDCTRVVLCTAGETDLMLSLTQLQGPQTGWEDVVVGFFVRPYPSYSNLNDAAGTLCYFSGGLVTGYLTSEMFGSVMLCQTMTFPDDVTGEYPMCPMGYFVNAGTHRGHKGYMPDMWWGSTVPPTGSTYPGDASFQFAHFYDVIVPWNGTSPEIA